jgi:hypothetical protein
MLGSCDIAVVLKAFARSAWCNERLLFMLKADEDRRSLKLKKPILKEPGQRIRLREASFCDSLPATQVIPRLSSDPSEMASPVKPGNQALSCCTDTPEAMPPKSTASSSESGAATEFLEFEGTTTFAPTPSPTYRYSMTLKSGKLRIWLEDCESKK